MRANPFLQQIEPQRQPDGLCAGQAAGSYRELTPHAFAAQANMGVILLKVPGGAAAFSAFRDVFSLDCSSEIDRVLAGWPRERAIGLVCMDGPCSGRLAIRLSRQGYTVYHLAGGLREWRQCCLPQ